jgi:hypothetical protein
MSMSTTQSSPIDNGDGFNISVIRKNRLPPDWWSNDALLLMVSNDAWALPEGPKKTTAISSPHLQRKEENSETPFLKNENWLCHNFGMIFVTQEISQLNKCWYFLHIPKMGPEFNLILNSRPKMKKPWGKLRSKPLKDHPFFPFFPW